MADNVARLPKTLKDGRWLCHGTRPGHGLAPDGRTQIVFVDFALSPVPGFLNVPAKEGIAGQEDAIGLVWELPHAEAFAQQLLGQIRAAREVAP